MLVSAAGFGAAVFLPSHNSHKAGNAQAHFMERFLRRRIVL